MDQNKKEKERARADAMAEARMKLIKIASVGIAGAVVLACYAYTKVEEVILQTALFGISSLIAVVSGLVIIGTVSLGREQRAKRNFFLYDRKSKKEMALTDLTLSHVRERIREFMGIFKHRGKLYVGELFDDNPHIPESFRTLFCYEILCELASGENSVDAKAFLGFGRECADIFSKYLRENGDYELATALNGFICDYSQDNNNSDSFKEYLKSKKEHIEEKMLSYAVENIEKFK